MHAGIEDVEEEDPGDDIDVSEFGSDLGSDEELPTYQSTNPVGDAFADGVGYNRLPVDRSNEARERRHQAREAAANLNIEGEHLGNVPAQGTYGEGEREGSLSSEEPEGEEQSEEEGSEGERVKEKPAPQVDDAGGEFDDIDQLQDDVEE